MKKSFNDPAYSVAVYKQQVNGYQNMLAGIWPLETARTSHVNCRNLSDWFVHNLDKKIPVYDIGCGRGFYVDEMVKSEFKSVTGFEGTPNIHSIAICDPKYLIVKDITTPINVKTQGTVICLEVMEHIWQADSDYVLTNIRNLCLQDLILSWALPGQGGTGHVNERDSNYVIPLLKKYGFVLHDENTLRIRDRAGQEINYFGQSLYVFRKTE